MGYCTITDISKLLPETQLAQLTTESGVTPDTDVVNEVIAQADSEIDSYCGVRFSVPFSPVPDRIKTLSVDISIYRIYLRRQLVPDPARQRYEDAIAFLKDVAKGNAVVGETATPPESGIGSAAPEFETSDRLFTRSSMRGL